MQLANTQDIGLSLEILTAVTAGAAAGILTCPLDVVKTRTQTQIIPDYSSASQATHLEKLVKKHKPPTISQTRSIHSGPRTVPTTAPTLDTSSIVQGLKLIYKTEGVGGWFRGVGPRAVWTGVQTGTMLVLYQYILKYMDMLQAKEGSSVV